MDFIPLFVWYIVGAIVLGAIIVVALKALWRVAAPSEALIISGRKRQTTDGEPDSLSFRIVTGGGTFVNPLFEQVEILDLSLNQVTPSVTCPTTQGVEVTVKGVVIFKIGDDERSIANAARRFTGAGSHMSDQMQEVFAGQLRSIVGGLTIEDMIQDRNALTEQTRAACAREAQSLGLVIDSLQIQEIGDPSGYIHNIAAPNLARVQRNARIAQAEADQEATEVEQRTEIAKATARRETALQTAAIQAEVEARQAEASEQGPLARARAQQEVLGEEALLAERRVAVRKQELDADVRLTADADAYATTARAEAERTAAVLRAQADAEATRTTGAARAEAARAEGTAEADVLRLKGAAEGDALKARGEGLAAHQEAVIGQIYAENLPEIVRAAASGLEHVDTLTVLNGADGLQNIVNSLIAQGGHVLNALMSSNPTAPSGEVAAPSGDRVD